MIDIAVLNDIREYSKDRTLKKRFEKFLVTDNHDIPYLNPFAAWHEEAHLSQASIGQLVTLQTIIAAGLIETVRSPPICEKYKWLARKLNSFVKRKKLAKKIALIDID